MKKIFLISFCLSLICTFLLGWIFPILSLNALPQTLMITQIEQNPVLNQAESIKQLVSTGKINNGDLQGVNITKVLAEAGLLSLNLDYQEYILSAFDGVLDLEGANLQGSDFKRLQVSRINLKNTDLTNADLTDVIWEEADFSGADMYWTRLNKARLENANFEEANMNYADLLGGNFSKANFINACMDGVDLRASNFTGANFENVVFDSDGPKDPQYLGANFANANLRNLGKDNLDCGGGAPSTEELKSNKSIYLCKTLMPDGTVSDRDCQSKWNGN